MIVFDTETTGLPRPGIAPLTEQPRIVEYCFVKLDDTTLAEVGRMSAFVNPKIPIPPETTKIHGITDAMVADAKPFSGHYGDLAQFVCGETTLVAHNLPFDRDLLTFELQRIDRLRQFPWPYRHTCTVEATKHLTGKYLRLQVLYKMAFGVDPQQTHRASGDVDLLVEVVRWMRPQGLI